MQITDTNTVQREADEALEQPTNKPSRRNRLLFTAVVAVLALAAGVVAALLLGGGEGAPEETVIQYIEAWNARDAEAVGDLLDPEIVTTYDARGIGSEFTRTTYGREMSVTSYVGAWRQWGPTTTGYEVVSVDGGTVTTTEQVKFATGARYQHSVVYEVSNGLILREDRVVEEFKLGP